MVRTGHVWARWPRRVRRGLGRTAPSVGARGTARPAPRPVGRRAGAPRGRAGSRPGRRPLRRTPRRGARVTEPGQDAGQQEVREPVAGVEVERGPQHRRRLGVAAALGQRVPVRVPQVRAQRGGLDGGRRGEQRVEDRGRARHRRRAGLRPAGPVDEGRLGTRPDRDQLEVVADLPQRLRVAQQQEAARPQHGVQPADQLPGGLGVEVDRHVAAQHQVDLARGVRRRVGDQVVLPEGDQRPHLGAHVVAAPGRRERPGQLLRGGAQQGAPAVVRRPGRLDRAPRHVGAEDLDVPARRDLGAQQHRQRVRLLAGRAAGAPHPQPAPGGGGPDQLRQDVRPQRVHLRRPEEAGLLHGDLVEQVLLLGGVVQPVEVGRDGAVAGGPQPLLDRQRERVPAPSVEREPGGPGQVPAQRLELRLGEPAHAGRPSRASSAGPILSSGSCWSTAPAVKAAAGMP